MAAPVNLNRYRKAKARAEAAAKADENSIRHGRSKAQKTLDKARAEKHASDLDQHKSKP